MVTLEDPADLPAQIILPKAPHKLTVIMLHGGRL
jgi:hypothetical protein